MNIGIERDTKLVYEAPSTHGYPVWPTPVLLQVVVASAEERIFTAAEHRDLAPNSLIFREETYNSSSRVRRGRLYRATGSPTENWYVQPHPALGREADLAAQNEGYFSKSVTAFHSFRLRPFLNSLDFDDPIFLLGAGEGFTIWTLVNFETSATGEEFVVLRARQSVGALPHIDRQRLLSLDGSRALDFIDKLEEEIYRAGAESVVDSCREAAAATISVYLQSINVSSPGEDLGGLSNKLDQEGFYVAARAGQIIARLHARRKNSEQERNDIRDIAEQDGQFAVQAFATILCDLGLAHWSL